MSTTIYPGDSSPIYSTDASRPMGRPMLPVESRQRLGAWLFLGSLLIFFLSTILFYGIVAYARRGDIQSNHPLPQSLLISTACLLVISVMVHLATRAIRRDRFVKTRRLLLISGVASMVFMGVQAQAMQTMLNGAASFNGLGHGLIGMVFVLAVLHALHVIGGIFSLFIVALRSGEGIYDHEKHFAVDFAAHYWHFLDLVWLCMLAAFYVTTGGFAAV